MKCEPLQLKLWGMWCFWRESSFHRRDGAAVARLHDEQGVPVSKYWLAWPPSFGDQRIDQAVMRRRFKTAERAMAFADKTWPEESAELDCSVN